MLFHQTKKQYLPTRRKNKQDHSQRNTSKRLYSCSQQSRLHQKKKKPVHVVVLLLLAKTTNLDLLYTVIERVASKKCDETDTRFVWAIFVIYFLPFFGLCLYRLWNYENEAQVKTMTQGSCDKIIVLVFLTSSFAALFILADSRMPLACSGIAETDFNLDIVRLVLWLVDFIIGFTMFGWWTWWYCCIYKKRYVKADVLQRFCACTA